MTDLPRYEMERDFDAPRELVWRCWTEADLVSHWYGPGVETVVHELDVRIGGVWKVEMRWGGNQNFQRADYTEVEPHSRLVCLMASTDADWNIAPNPMMPDWPKVLTTIVTLEAMGDKTRLRLVWEPKDASAAELDCFKNAVDNMGKGWGAGMEMLATMLAEMQS